MGWYEKHFPALLQVILLLCIVSQSCMSHKLWAVGIYPGNPSLDLKRQRRLVGRCLVKNSSISPGLLFEAWCCVLPRVSQHRYGAIRETTLLLLADGRVCGVCVCVFLPTFGWGFWFMGGREVEFGEEEEVEKCGERSAEAQLVRPPLQPAAASKEPVSSLPACLPACTCLPLSFSFCPLTPPALPLSCPPADSAQLFQAFYSPPLPLCPLTPRKKKKKNPPWIYKQVCMLPSVRAHISADRFCPVEWVIQ